MKKIQETRKNNQLEYSKIEADKAGVYVPVKSINGKIKIDFRYRTEVDEGERLPKLPAGYRAWAFIQKAC